MPARAGWPDHVAVVPRSIIPGCSRRSTNPHGAATVDTAGALDAAQCRYHAAHAYCRQSRSAIRAASDRTPCRAK
jgi:hypothetical protein